VLSRRHFLYSSALSPLLAVAAAPDRAGFQPIDARWLDGPPVHLFGDSISRGYALEDHAEKIPESNRLYEFRSIASMANLVLRDNGHDALFAFAGEAVGENAKPRAVEKYIGDGLVRPGDIVVITDAGDYRGGPRAYLRELAELRRIVTERQNITCIMMTMFDYPPAGPEFQFDRPVDGMTRNDAIRAAASERQPYEGRTILLDLNEEMDRLRASALRQDGVDVVLKDGIHPNVWGQMLITGEILKAAGFRRHLAHADTAVSIAKANWKDLAYDSKRFSAKRAEQLVRHCLLR
jgi:hypothetical protein